MKMQASLGNPLLIFIYSAALLMIGCAIGIQWRVHPEKAFIFAFGGGILMVIHDTGAAFLWFWVTAKMYASMQRSGK